MQTVAERLQWIHLPQLHLLVTLPEVSLNGNTT